jgi:hypothetical protein
VDSPAKPRHAIAERFQKPAAVLVVTEDLSPFIPPRHHVIDRPSKFDA